MNASVFSCNLRRLRLAKNMTQEQLAEKLGVSAQSVSRWECGNTLPDVLLLPQIAKLYAVTVDDLYRENAPGYASYAQRLLAVYEASGQTEDFLAAEQAFIRMESPSADDLRSWGVLYHYMAQFCAAQAEKKLQSAMSHPQATEQDYLSAAQQNIALMWELGRGAQVTAQYESAAAAAPYDYHANLLYAAAYAFSQDQNQALQAALQGIARFPTSAALRIYAGDACRNLGRYEEAFVHWESALALDDRYLDAHYSMAFCYEELGQYDKAAAQWESLSAALCRRGLTVEQEFPSRQAILCRKKA